MFSLAVTTTCAWLDLNTIVTPLAGGVPLTAIPKYLRGRFIFMQCDTADVYFAVSNDATTAIVAAATGSPGATACGRLIFGQNPIRYMVEGEGSLYPNLAYLTAAGTATLRIWVSTGKVF